MQIFLNNNLLLVQPESCRALAKDPVTLAQAVEGAGGVLVISQTHTEFERDCDSRVVKEKRNSQRHKV